MPHYADGTAAQLGDQVKGKPYNTPHDVVGTIVSITPNSEACNCQVAFVEVTDLPVVPTVPAPGIMIGTRSNGSHYSIAPRIDHGETRAFTKIVAILLLCLFIGPRVEARPRWKTIAKYAVVVAATVGISMLADRDHKHHVKLPKPKPCVDQDHPPGHEHDGDTAGSDSAECR
jgi:hypothetical protein